jgi:hypothetical protein
MQIQQKKTLSASRVPPNRDEPPTGADMSIRFDNQDVTRDDPAYSSGPTAADSRDTGRNATRVQDPMTSSDQTHTGRSNTHLGDIEVERLAARALRILVDRAEVSDAATPFAQLFALTDAYLDADSRARHDLLAGLLRRGVSPTQVVEEIVPATARYMGKLWVHDKLSFAEVTIGAARLQETVRAMTVRRPRKTHHDAAPRILLIVPRTKHHTLGIFVLAEQFRRRGCLVHVIVGSHPQEILDTNPREAVRPGRDFGRRSTQSGGRPGPDSSDPDRGAAKPYDRRGRGRSGPRSGCRIRHGCRFRNM